MTIVALGCALAVASPAHVAQSQDRERAAEHFARGLELFNEGRHDAALAEFSAAYDLAPAPGILYNLGRVHAALGNAVQAVDAFERYLAQEDGVAPTRRREVERLLRQQRPRIARLHVTTNVSGSVISIAGVDVATTPLEAPIRVTAGRLQVGARAPGHESIRLSIQVAGDVDRNLEIELRREERPRGTVRVLTPVPGVRVTIDGDDFGLTPLDRTLPLDAGRHAIVGVRRGYVPQRVEIDLEEGAEVEVRLDMGRDPATSRTNLGRLRLHLPEVAHTVRIDDEVVETRGGTVEVVAGPHSLELICADREPYRQLVEVPSGGSVDLTPQLEWTPDARAERLEAASARRAFGWWILLPGAVVAATVGALWYLNERDISDLDDRVATANRLIEERMCPSTAGDPCRTMAFADAGVDERTVGDQQNDQDLIRWTTGPTALLGLAATTVGIVLVAGADSEEDVDRAAHASGATLRLGVSPSAVRLSGRF